MTLKEDIGQGKYGTKNRLELLRRIGAIERAVADIQWMARRYANGSQTYAPGMFNDAYDILRTEFGEEFDPKNALDMQNVRYHDIVLSHTDKHPYAEHAREDSQENKGIQHRKFYGA